MENYVKTKKEQKQLLDITTEYIKELSKTTAKLKIGITPEKVLKSISKEISLVEDEERVTEFINDSSEEVEGEHISLIDMLYSYNEWSKSKLNRNKFLQIVKEQKFEVKNVKIRGRMFQCFTNRKWKADYEELKENSNKISTRGTTAPAGLEK